MSKKMGQVMEIHAKLDEAALRKVLIQIEQLRASPETAGLDLCYGAVVTLEVVPELVGSEPTMHCCRIRAGGWSPDLPPRTQAQKGGLQP